MRPDVKLGVVVSMVVVSVAGVYYLYRDKAEAAIPISVRPGAVADTVPAKTNPTPGSAVTKRQPQATRPTATPNASKGQSPAARPMASPVASKPQPGTKTAQPAVARRRVPGNKPGVVPGTKTAQRNASGPVNAGRPAARKTPALSTKPRTAQGSPSLQEKLGQTAAPLAARAKPTIAADFHRVQDGDTFSALSERYYGSASFSSFLIASNPQIADANRLRVGDSIKIPARPVAQPARKIARGATTRPSSPATPVAAGRTYTVQPGDSFYKIAKERLGDAARWKELFELNKDTVGRDPSRLAVGQVLTLPKS